MVDLIMRLSMTACFLIAVAHNAAAELPSAEKIQSSQAKDAISDYEKEKNELDTIYRGVLRELNTKFRSAMETNRKKLQDALVAARKEAAANDQLDQALLLRDAAGEVAAFTIEIPGAESSSLEDQRRAKSPTAGLADLTTQQLEAKVVGTWQANDGTTWQIKPDAKIESNHPMKLFQSCGFYVRTQNEDIYLGLARPGNGCAMMKLVDLDTLITVNTRPSLVLKRKEE